MEKGTTGLNLEACDVVNGVIWKQEVGKPPEQIPAVMLRLTIRELPSMQVRQWPWLAMTVQQSQEIVEQMQRHALQAIALGSSSDGPPQ